MKITNKKKYIYMIEGYRFQWYFSFYWVRIFSIDFSPDLKFMMI
jgi:hypothetical protein